jgi:hypothetical protein
LVCYFHGHKSGLVIGPVVWDQISEVMAASGVDKLNADDCEFWPGHWIELHRDRTPFGGKMVPCIRARSPGTIPVTAKKKSAKKSKPDTEPDFNDPADI